MIHRRAFITSVGVGILIAPLVGEAQQAANIPRIGLLSPFSPSATALWHQAFRHGLRDLGWIEGQNISIEYRYSEGRDDRLPELAADLVRLKVDIIVAAGTADSLAAKSATRTIPIVVATVGDPVAIGLVESLARPGGNITGLTNLSAEMAGKRLELLARSTQPQRFRQSVRRRDQGARWRSCHHARPGVRDDLEGSEAR